MSFSSRRRNYLLTPHRRDGLIEWMKSMLMHSFVLNALDTTGADTFSHFEMLIDEHRAMTMADSSSSSSYLALDGSPSKASSHPSRLKQLVPTVGVFHTHLPLRRAFEAYNAKYGITKRRHICVSFNEIRHILNLAQVIAMIDRGSDGCDGEGGRADDPAASADEKRRSYSAHVQAWTTETTPRLPGMYDEKSDAAESDDINGGTGNRVGRSSRSESFAEEFPVFDGDSAGKLLGPGLISFDGDQTLYSDGANFESNPKLAKYLYTLLRKGVLIAVVTAAGYEYHAEKYELRLSGLLAYFKEMKLSREDCERFYIFGGECNYLLRLGEDYRLHSVREDGPGGWLISTKHMSEAPGNWAESEIAAVLDKAEASFRNSLSELNLRANIIRKKRSVGLIPKNDEKIPREALDELVLRIKTELDESKVSLPFCAFNGGRDAWVDVGNKRVGVQVLQSYLGIPLEKTLHIGDQFLNNGNDFAARSVCPCVWITSPEETTYILKSILRLAGVSLSIEPTIEKRKGAGSEGGRRETVDSASSSESRKLDFAEIDRRSSRVQMMDVYTGEMISKASVA